MIPDSVFRKSVHNPQSSWSGCLLYKHLFVKQYCAGPDQRSFRPVQIFQSFQERDVQTILLNGCYDSILKGLHLHQTSEIERKLGSYEYMYLTRNSIAFIWFSKGLLQKVVPETLGMFVWGSVICAELSGVTWILLSSLQFPPCVNS